MGAPIPRDAFESCLEVLTLFPAQGSPGAETVNPRLRAQVLSTILLINAGLWAAAFVAVTGRMA